MPFHENVPSYSTALINLLMAFFVTFCLLVWFLAWKESDDVSGIFLLTVIWSSLPFCILKKRNLDTVVFRFKEEFWFRQDCMIVNWLNYTRYVYTYFLCGMISNQADDIYLADLALCHLILDAGGHPLWALVALALLTLVPKSRKLKKM